MIFLDAVVREKNKNVTVAGDFYATLGRYVKFGYCIVERGLDTTGVIRQEWYVMEKGDRQISMNIWRYGESGKVMDNQYKILGLTK